VCVCVQALGLDKYIEMNVYVTAAPKKKEGVVHQPSKLDLGNLSQAHALNVGYDVDIGFDEERLTRAMLNPTMPSDKQRDIQGTLQGADGRLMDIWIWNGALPAGWLGRACRPDLDARARGWGVQAGRTGATSSCRSSSSASPT
jgi:hypothetical protein